MEGSHDQSTWPQLVEQQACSYVHQYTGNVVQRSSGQLGCRALFEYSS